MKHFTTIFLLCVLVVPASLAKINFAELDLRLIEDQNNIIVDGNLRLQLSKAAEEALSNGLPLVFIAEAEVLEPRPFFWDKKVWSKSYQLDIQYHALSDQYLVKNVQGDFQRAFLTRNTAIEALGRIDNLALIPKQNLDGVIEPRLMFRARLDTSALPVPLRPMVYLSDKWRLISDWKTWPLK